MPVPYRQLRADSSGPEKCSNPNLDEQAFTIGQASRIALRPCLSDIPYLVLAPDDIQILSGATAEFTVFLPPLLSLQLESGIVLGESMPFIVSRTWFGDKVSGTLCVSLPSALDLRERTVPHAGFATQIQCKIKVRNNARTALHLNRLAVYTNLLSVYQNGSSLISDTVVVNSTTDGSLRMSIDDKPYKGLPKLVEGVKSGFSEVLVRSGVNFLKSVTGL